MKTAHGSISRHAMTEYMPHEKIVHTSPDYFNEALRILDNDLRISPQREHLAALWGLVIGLSHRLTQALATCQHNRSTSIRKNRRRRPPFPAAGSG